MNYSQLAELAQVAISIANLLLVLTIALSGWFYFWPRFIRQKRIENANENSWRVLKILDAAEEASISLFWAFNMRKSDEEQHLLQKNTITALKNLRTGFLVLKETTPEIKEHLNELDRILHAHQNRIVTVKSNQRRPYSASIDLLGDLQLLGNLNEGPYTHKEPDLVKFEELRTLIASIAGLYHKNF